MTSLSPAVSPRRLQLERLADLFAMGVVVALPWSTSGTLIFAVLWLCVLLPTLSWPSVRDAVALPICAVPVALCALAALGMLWADVSWSERLHGLNPFLRLLAIPLLVIQCARSASGAWLLSAFMASVAMLLAASWLLALFPSLPVPVRDYGIPVRDYISQSGFFTLAMFALLFAAVRAWRERHTGQAALMAVAALAFAANMAFVAMSRTAIVSIVVLACLFAISVFGWRRAVAAIAVFAILAGLAWSLSPYLRARASAIIQEVSAYREGREVPSGGRLEFWSRSLAFLHASPVIGTGTGSIRDTFRRNSPDPAREIASNPHNQIFAVGIQLGAVGIAVLLAMWAGHLAFFAAVPGTVGWFGLTVVTQNIVSSLFNSHLMDFTQSWLYVLGVGIAGGMVLRARKWRPAP